MGGENENIERYNMFKIFSKWRRQRQTVSELSRMSDRELNDLGISRCEIHRIAREASL